MRASHLRFIFALNVLATLTPTSLFAEETHNLKLEPACRGAVVSLMNMYAEQGYRNVGSRTVAEIQKRIQKTSWQSAPVYFLAGPDGKRMSGTTLVKENAVILGLPARMLLVEHRIPHPGNQFILHEGLGAAGIHDEDYRSGISIYYLGYRHEKIPSETVRKFLASQVSDVAFFTQNQRVLFADNGGRGGASGGTGVGGGGDISALDLKLRLVEEWAFAGDRPIEKLQKIFAVNVVSGYDSDVKTEFTPRTITILHNEWYADDRAAREKYQKDSVAAAIRVLAL